MTPQHDRDELREQILAVFMNDVVDEEPYLSREWGTDGIESIMRLFDTHVAAIERSADTRTRLDELTELLKADADSGLTYGGMNSDKPCIEVRAIERRIAQLRTTQEARKPHG